MTPENCHYQHHAEFYWHGELTYQQLKRVFNNRNQRKICEVCTSQNFNDLFKKFHLAFFPISFYNISSTHNKKLRH